MRENKKFRRLGRFFVLTGFLFVNARDDRPLQNAENLTNKPKLSTFHFLFPITYRHLFPQDRAILCIFLL